MNSLTQAERFHLEAVEGWLMLGNSLEANDELERIKGDAAYHPAVLAMRWQVYVHAGWWEAACVVSKALCAFAPDSPTSWICQANTLRHYKGVGEAWSLLQSVAGKFERDAVIRYNLACYSAQMGLFDESCNWLVQAFELEQDSQLKVVALKDPDLEPLWNKIGRHRLFEVTRHLSPALVTKE